MTNYKQLQSKERHLIDYLLNQESKSVSQIAVILKRNKSTISQEIRRNKLQTKYQANDAVFLSKIINLKKQSFSINKYQKFLNYFYEIDLVVSSWQTKVDHKTWLRLNNCFI